MKVEFFFILVNVGGGFDHLPILHQIDKRDSKSTTYFKFNLDWVNEEDYIKVVKEACKLIFYPSSRDTTSLSLLNLSRRIKKL
jgi:hypothetical protein